MRLTLRILLAYLDDMLDPATTKEVGQRIGESPAAQELIARIRKVTRQRHLTTPDESAAAGKPADANTVAEYLDGKISPEEAAEIEQICLEHDVHLAEFASVHQMLTLISGEPADVPPLAYQRMYRLVRGPESIPTRQPPSTSLDGEKSPAEPRDDVADEALLLGLPSYRLRGSQIRRWAPAAAVILVAIGLVVLFQAITGRQQQRPTELEEPIASVDLESLIYGPGSIPVVAGWVASRPTLPANLMVMVGARETLDRQIPLEPRPGLPEPIVPPPEPATPPAIPKPIGLRPPSGARVTLGTLTSLTTKESLLFRRLSLEENSGPEPRWRLVRPQAPVQSGNPLVVLPGFRSEITLNSKVLIHLVGHLEEVATKYVLESAAELHENREFDVDLTLHRGRIVLAHQKPAGPAKCRVRFKGVVWDILLEQPASMVGLELTSRLLRGSPSSHVKLTLSTVGGGIKLTRGEISETIDAGKLVLWDDQTPASLTSVPFPQPAPPAWIFRTPKFDEALIAQLIVEKQLLDKIGNLKPDQESSFIPVAFEESLGGGRVMERKLAIYSLGALDYLPPIIPALDDPDRPDVRSAALTAILHWLGRGVGQSAELEKILRQSGHTDAETGIILPLLQGFAAANEGAFDFLLRQLTHDRLAIRELAYLNLRELTTPQQRVNFDPAGTSEQRAKAVEAWRARLVPKRQ